MMHFDNEVFTWHTLVIANNTRYEFLTKRITWISSKCISTILMRSSLERFMFRQHSLGNLDWIAFKVWMVHVQNQTSNLNIVCKPVWYISRFFWAYVWLYRKNDHNSIIFGAKERSKKPSQSKHELWKLECSFRMNFIQYWHTEQPATFIVAAPFPSHEFHYFCPSSTLDLFGVGKYV